MMRLRTFLGVDKRRAGGELPDVFIFRYAFMDLGWFDDLIAIGETDTLTEAAKRRHLSQPAFSRRIQAIEHWLGMPVVERAFRPARLVDTVFRKLPEFRFIVRRVSELRSAILAENKATAEISIAALHSIMTGILPTFLAYLQELFPDISTRLIAAEREDCYALLMTRQVPLLVVYETERFPIAPDEDSIEKRVLGYDKLIPVASKADIERTNDFSGKKLSIIAYPAHSFFGSVVYEDLLPRLYDQFEIQTISETVLVPAALELALAGLGVAWIPRALAAIHIKLGRLVSLESEFGHATLTVVAARRDGPKDDVFDKVWEAFTSLATNECSTVFKLGAG